MNETNQDGPRVAVVLNRDLLFGSRIRGALAGLGLEAKFVTDTAHFVGALRAHPESAAIGIIDMNGRVDWDVLAGALSASEPPAPTLAFGPHVDVDNRRAAKAAGVSRIVSNGQFHAETAALIDRYRRR